MQDIPQATGILDIIEAVSEKCEEFELTVHDQQPEQEELEVNNSLVEQVGHNTTSTSEQEELEANDTLVEQLVLEQQQVSTPKEKQVSSILEEGTGEEISPLKGNRNLLNEVDFSAEVGDILTNTVSSSTLDTGANKTDEESLQLRQGNKESNQLIETETPVTRNRENSNLVILDNINESWNSRTLAISKENFQSTFQM